MRGSSFFVGAAIAALTISSVAHAQGEGEDDQRARLHFEAGRSYFEEGDYEQALDEFQRAYDLSERPVLLVNIANCQERLGQWQEAATSLTTFVDSLPPEDAQRPTMQRRIDNLRARAAQHQPPPDRTSDTTSDATSTSDTTSGTATTSAATSTFTPASDGLLAPAIAAFSVGGAGLILWATLGGLALTEEQAVSSGCGATTSCTAAQVQAMDDLALGADIAMAVGIAGVATGVILIVVDPPHGASGTTEATASIAPYGSRDGAGLTITGSF